MSRRNRVLESLRGLLETLAGPERLHGGLEIALLALLDGLGADAAAVIAGDGGAGEFRSVAHRSLGTGSAEVRAHLRAAAGAVLAGQDPVPARLAGPGLAAVSLRLPGQRGRSPPAGIRAPRSPRTRWSCSTTPAGRSPWPSSARRWRRPGRRLRRCAGPRASSGTCCPRSAMNCVPR